MQAIALFAATSGHSGVDRVIGNLTRQFAAWGLTVDLLKIRNHGPNLATADLPGVRVVDLGCAHVNAALPALVRYLRRERPRVLLTDKDKVNRTAILARMLARVPTRLAVRVGTTVSVNLASRGRFQRWQQRTSIRRLYPYADCVIVPSIGVAEDMTDYTGLDRGHIRVVPSPIVTPDLERKAAEPANHPWMAARDMPVILGVGELGHRKDFETLVRAFALVRRSLPCRLMILGRGRRRDALLALARKLGVAHDLDLPGFQPNPYAFMSRADLFVLSSRWEGLGIVLVEALACGTPVVSTDCPHGPREILEDGRYGRLVPVEDHRALAAAMAESLIDPPEAETLKRRALAFSSESSAAAYLRALGLPDAIPGEWR